MARWCFFPLLAAVLLVQLSLAIDVSTNHEPQGPLGVRIDYTEVKRSKSKIDKDHILLFSSHLTFRSGVDAISDEQLHQMAQDAFKEMQANYLLYKPSKPQDSTPGALGVLAIGNDVFIASTRKGRGSFVEQLKQTPVSSILSECNTLWGSWDNYPSAPASTNLPADMDAHVHKAKCAEVNLLQQYYQLYPTDHDHTGKVRMATIVQTKIGSQILPPCGSTELVTKPNGKFTQWGCKLVLEAMGETDIGPIKFLSPKIKTATYDLSTLAGGLLKKDQVSVCSSPINPKAPSASKVQPIVKPASPGVGVNV